ncbi:hypothetical protein Tco_0648154 [Tanacetum coccineum]
MFLHDTSDAQRIFLALNQRSEAIQETDHNKNQLRIQIEDLLEALRRVKEMIKEESKEAVKMESKAEV